MKREIVGCEACMFLKIKTVQLGVSLNEVAA